MVPAGVRFPGVLQSGHIRLYTTMSIMLHHPLHYASVARKLEEFDKRSTIRKHMLALHHLNALAFSLRYEETDPGDAIPGWSVSSIAEQKDLKVLSDTELFNALESIDYNCPTGLAKDAGRIKPAHRAALKWLDSMVLKVARRLLHELQVTGVKGWSIEP